MAELMLQGLPEGFPRFESQSRKQMKDVELVANLLLYFEEGVRGYSQDELDQAFSDRDVEWEGRDDAALRFGRTLKCLAQFVRLPEAAPLYKTRLRNQADFYSLFTAAAELCKESESPCEDPVLPERLAQFISIVEDEEQRKDNKDALDYFAAARSNSNDTGPRKTRTTTLFRIMCG